MDNNEGLKLMLDALGIFQAAQAAFDEPFWERMCEFLGGDNPVDCTWSQTGDFYERLQEFAEQEGVVADD